MPHDSKNSETPRGTYSLTDYQKRLANFDAVVCEVAALGQAAANRIESPSIGYSTHVFGRICAHSQALICAAPKSRWVRREFDIWDVSTVAAHARSILEGYLLFRYLADAPKDLDTQQAYVQVMHLYDCKKRIGILPHILPPEDIEGLESQAAEIKSRLKNTSYFNGLDGRTKKEILRGKHLMIMPKHKLIEQLGIDQEDFNFYWNYLSQYTHVLSFTFYRVEPNGRGTGLENDFDRDALCMVLEFCTGLLTAANDRFVELFPDTANSRRGLNSKFAPGPRRNLPRRKRRTFRSFTEWLGAKQ